MEKLKEYFKLFTYIFYPGIVFILYFAQFIEGNISKDLIFCPTDLVFVGSILGVYILLDTFKVLDKKIFKKIRNDKGKLKVPFVFIGIILLVLVMGLYDDLKVYFYLNNDVSINLLIIVIIWLILWGICYFFNKKENNH